MDTTVKNTEVNSVPAWGMTTQTNATKIYGSADDQAHLRHVEGPKGQLGLLDFTEWNAVAPTSPPLANQLVKIPGPQPLCWNLSAGTSLLEPLCWPVPSLLQAVDVRSCQPTTAAASLGHAGAIPD